MVWKRNGDVVGTCKNHLPGARVPIGPSALTAYNNGKPGHLSLNPTELRIEFCSFLVQ